VIHQHDKLAVRYYAPTGESIRKTPVILVPSLINRAYILDLEPDRSVVGSLSAMGHPVYLVDWGIPGEEDAGEDTGYVLHDLLSRSIDRICRHAAQPKALVFGYCQGGVLAAMLAALAPERFAGLVLLNAPFRFSEGGRFRDLVAPEVMDVDKAMPGGLVSVDTMQAGFKLLDPMGNWTKYIAVEKASADPARMARVLARERWLEENVPLPAAFAREFVRYAYQKDALLDGGWVIRGKEVNLREITCPVLVVASERDFIAPKEACLPVAEATGSDDVTVQVIPTGHIGCVVGSAASRHLLPLLDQWFRRVQP
jgi:polyhydroxyalkanoate synthase